MKDKELKVKVLIGDEVYKICPKCNDNHNGTCEHCAWRGCIWSYCDIEPRIYSDGNGNKKAWQMVKRKVTEQSFVHINEEWGVSYFATIENGLKAIEEFNDICKIEDRQERCSAFLRWRDSRKQCSGFRRDNNER